MVVISFIGFNVLCLTCSSDAFVFTLAEKKNSGFLSRDFAKLSGASRATRFSQVRQGLACASPLALLDGAVRKRKSEDNHRVPSRFCATAAGGFARPSVRRSKSGRGLPRSKPLREWRRDQGDSGHFSALGTIHPLFAIRGRHHDTSISARPKQAVGPFDAPKMNSGAGIPTRPTSAVSRGENSAVGADGDEAVLGVNDGIKPLPGIRGLKGPTLSIF